MMKGVLSIAIIVVFVISSFIYKVEISKPGRFNSLPTRKREKRYFNSFHELDNSASTETYVHVENDSLFDAEVYYTVTGNLIDSVSGIITQLQFRTTKGIIIGNYSSDSISIFLEQRIIICRKR
jgi:hypothetical protein